MNKRKIAGYVFSVFALISWIIFGILKHGAHVAAKVANQPHGPADPNGIVGVIGFGADIISSLALMIAIVFSLIAAVLLLKSSSRS